MNFSVYIVQCADGTLYTGIATDVTRRVDEHNGLTPSGTKSRRGAGYTSARRPVALVYAIILETRSAAAKEEARLKSLSRAQKLALIAAHSGTDTPTVTEGAALDPRTLAHTDP
jgi:putative endonuclease